MKTMSAVLIIIALGAGLALAQEFIPADPPPAGDHPPADIPSMVEKWLDHLRETDPDEYDRLLQLRREDQDAFREELREKLKDHMRKRFAERGRGEFGQPGAPGAPPGRDHARKPHGGRRPDGEYSRDGMRGRMRDKGRRAPNPESAALEEKVHDLTKAYHQAGVDEKEAARARLKTALSDLFDMREQERIAQLKRMQEELKKFQDIMEKRKSMRTDIIERRLQQITNPELNW